MPKSGVGPGSAVGGGLSCGSKNTSGGCEIERRERRQVDAAKKRGSEITRSLQRLNRTSTNAVEETEAMKTELLSAQRGEWAARKEDREGPEK